MYCAPGEETYRVDGAQVDTDETVLIYGVENGWVLVSYTIGNGSRGRIGYIKNTTLADAEMSPVKSTRSSRESRQIPPAV